MTDMILVRVNCPERGLAEEIGRKAVELQLAACANIDGPVTSVYHWDGAIETGEEHVLWLKTREAFWPEIEAFISALHPDDTPAILAIPCLNANARYEAWLHANTKAQ
ncbi:MAG: divalent-cation tolerance protein CutA [Ponticaulis sp.]|nr:divalent-cation tolerance protein CutA [Ponticaulis sp.]